MRKMKDSGVFWIDKIPESWKLRRGKNLYKIDTGKLDANAEELDGKYPFFTCSMFPKRINTYAFDGEALMVAGNGIVGFTQYYKGKFNAYQRTYVLSDFREANPHFLKYYVSNNLSIEVAPNSVGSVIQFIKLGDLQNFHIVFPDSIEQEKIANFLDEKVTEIDKVIEKTKETIEEYKKYKQSIINEMVTKGLDKDDKMKVSGVDWINKIPEKWQVYRTKEFFEFGKGLPITKANLINDGEKVISYGQIHSKSNTGTNVKEELYRYVSNEYLKSNYQSIVKYNDFIFADTSEDLDGCGNCVYIDKNINVFAGYHTIILKPKVKDDMKYFAYLFLTDAWRSQIRSRVSGIKLFSITQKILKETTIIIPEKKERENIVKYLDKKCSEIDNLIKNKENLITELENYKKSLIYEYVTGKKEVKNSNYINDVNPRGIKVNCKDSIFAQAILLCKIIEELSNYNLGRVKAEKTLYLIEKDVGFEFCNNYVREKAGPLAEPIYKCETIISERNKWVKVKNVNKHIEYEILSDFNKYKKYYNNYYSDYDDKIEKVIEIIKKCATDKAEMIATLYASWNDFIIKGEQVSDIQIVKDVRENWNDTKKRFSEKKWIDVLNEMKQIGLTPKGNGNLTIIKEQ